MDRVTTPPARLAAWSVGNAKSFVVVVELQKKKKSLRLMSFRPIFAQWRPCC